MKNYFFFFLLIFSFSAYTQNIKNISVKGHVIDTLNETVPAATVMLLNSSDSTLVNYTTTNSSGDFVFKSVKNTGYILKISHVSFMPIQKMVPISSNEVYDFGTIKVEPIAEVLMEVVIKSAQAPLFIHGDTVEYDASLFKVPPGSSVEDLLKRLPGIQVDADGNISSNGKDVRRIYVDGKTFFGDDPKSVTKNLDAEAISRVQVYDEQSEQERLTGIEDGSDDKAMNLELKDEYKKGYFGKASVAAGTEERWAARGSFNRFNETSQLSFIAYGNNINATGVNWEDYQEFKGSSAYSEYDNGDFGFNSRSYGHYFSYGSSYSDNGFTENVGGGTNYNYFKDKVKFNVSYMYSQTDRFYDMFSKRQTFLTDSTYFRFDTTNYSQFTNSHSISSRFEIEIDSNNTWIVRVNSRLSGNNRLTKEYQLYQTDAPLYSDINMNSMSDSSDLASISANLLTLYNHKFSKKGRSFSISGAADISQSLTNKRTVNINDYYLSLTPSEQIAYIYDNTSAQNLYKSSVMYVEPFNKRFSMMAFYNFSMNETKSGKIVEDELNSNAIVNSMTNYYIHDVMYNRLGSSINYAWQGLNIALGGAYQIIELSGRYALLEASDTYSDLAPKSYANFTPYFRTQWQLPNNMRLSASYSYDVDEPSMSQLQPIVDNSNPLYSVEGNLLLSPEISHNVRTGFNYWNQSSFTSFSVNASASFNENTIVYNQNTVFVDDIGYVTTSKPENVEGGKNSSISGWFSVPIIKTVLTTNVWAGTRFSETPVFINTVENITNSKYYYGHLGINLTIGPKLSFSCSAGANNSNVEYSIQSDQNQKILSYSLNSGVKWQFLKKTYFEGNVGWEEANSDRLDYTTDFLIANVSVRQIFGKKNQFEARIACFDLFNQRISLDQYAMSNYTLYEESPTLARYFMLSLAYNLKGFETKMKNRRGW